MRVVDEEPDNNNRELQQARTHAAMAQMKSSSELPHSKNRLHEEEKKKELDGIFPVAFPSVSLPSRFFYFARQFKYNCRLPITTRTTTHLPGPLLFVSTLQSTAAKRVSMGLEVPTLSLSVMRLLSVSVSLVERESVAKVKTLRCVSERESESETESRESE